jgi:hypothetical protein
VFTVVIRGGQQDFPLVTIGRETYIAGMSIQDSPEEPEISNIHIGSFCSIATNVTLMAYMGHDYKAVSTIRLSQRPHFSTLLPTRVTERRGKS